MSLDLRSEWLRLLVLLVFWSTVSCQTGVVCPGGYHFDEEQGGCVDTTDYIVNWAVLCTVLVMLVILLVLVGFVCYRWWPRPEPLTLAPDSSQDKRREMPLLVKADGSTLSSTRTPEMAEEADSVWGHEKERRVRVCPRDAGIRFDWAAVSLCSQAILDCDSLARHEYIVSRIR